MKKILLILLLCGTAFGQSKIDDVLLPYWKITSDDPNQMKFYVKSLVAELQDILDNIRNAVNTGIDLSGTDAVYFGLPGVDGLYADDTWRLYQVSADDFEIQKKVSGTWTKIAKWSYDDGLELIDGSFNVSADGIITAAGLGVTGNTINITGERTISGSSATGTKGDICKDDDYLYICTATDKWDRIALSPWVSTGGALQSVSGNNFFNIPDLQIYAAAYTTSNLTVNIRDYGAMGDGTTDDADAINTAIGDGYRTVLFPYTPNGYLIGSSIEIKTGTILQGATRFVTLIPNAETFAAITVTGGVSYWSIRDLSINYGEATGNLASANAAAVGIQLLIDGADYPYMFDISNVMIFYPYRGFEAASVPCFMFSLRHVFVRNAGDYAFWIDPPAVATTVVLQNCYTNISKGGFRLEKITELAMSSCAADHVDGEYGFYFETCTGTGLGLHVEQGTLTAAAIACVGGNMLLVGPKFSSNTLVGGGFELLATSAASIEVVGGVSYNTVCSGAGTYATIQASATADQLIVRGGKFVIPTGDGTKYIYNGNIRIYNTNATVEPIISLADEATPTVAAGTLFKTSGTANDPFTDFLDGVTGQKITIFADHSVVVTDGTNIFLNGSANWTMTATDSLTLIQKVDGKWYEVSRGDNGA